MINLILSGINGKFKNSSLIFLGNYRNSMRLTATKL